MSSESGSFTFLQISDVHLGSRQLALGAPLSPPQRRLREQEIMQTFLRSFELAREQNVDVVLIPGDLWENKTVTASTISEFIEACASLGDIPVFIAPGNRDCYSVDSPYNPKTLELRGLPPLPHNVSIFKDEHFVVTRHPRRSDVTFTGRAFTSGAVVTERLLQKQIPKDEASINFLLFHGALEGYTGVDSQWIDKQTAPFSAFELKAQNFTYAALGHYHEVCQVRTENGTLLGAYSGSPCGRNFDEPGAHCVLFGVVEPTGSGLYNIQLEPVELDNRRLLSVSTDITGLSDQDMMDEITLAIEDLGGRPDQDIILLTLDGEHIPSVDMQRVFDQLRARYSQLVVIDNARPDYLSVKFDPRTTEAKYIDALIALKRDVERNRGAQPDSKALSGTIVEDALYYGLDALRQRRIKVRNVD